MKICRNINIYLHFTNAQLKISQFSIRNLVKSDHLLLTVYRRTTSKVPRPQILRKIKWSKIDWDKANFADE